MDKVLLVIGIKISTEHLTHDNKHFLVSTYLFKNRDQYNASHRIDAQEHYEYVLWSKYVKNQSLNCCVNFESSQNDW